MSFTATGGVVTTDGDHTVHTFIEGGTLVCDGATYADVLVAGSGGGGCLGGGGGGEVLIARVLLSGSMPAVVGAGGDGAPPGWHGPGGADGEASSFAGLEAAGGHGGKDYGHSPTPLGGSSATGYAGGAGVAPDAGGGGAGCTGPGTAANPTGNDHGGPKGGDGGPGVTSSISGSELGYGGGAGGSWYDSGVGTHDYHGHGQDGGADGDEYVIEMFSGRPNSGGGGQAGFYAYGYLAAPDGVVIVRYLTGGEPVCTLTINEGATATDDNDVTLALDPTGFTPGQMRFSNNGSTWSGWETFAPTKAWQLPAQTSYPSQAKTVYAQVRESDPVAAQASINLEVSWTGSVVIANRDAEQTYERAASVRFKGTSSAQGGAGHGDDLVRRYRIRDSAGSWSAWTTASPAADSWTTVSLTFAGDGVRAAQVQWEDDDGNLWTAQDSIEVLPTGEVAGGAPPVIDITNWRLLIGGMDFIDACDGPPQFTMGQHGPGSLNASIPVTNPLLPYANELKPKADVELWDGPLRLWWGYLKPLSPVSDDASALTIEARGPLDQAKQDETYVVTYCDSDPAHWTVSPNAAKSFTCDLEGHIKILHEKGHACEGGAGAGIWYWVNGGRRDQAIDHIECEASDIDVDASNWYARVQVASSPWGSWDTAKEWNNVATSGAKRVPASGSFAEAGFPDAYAVKVLLVSSADLTAAESANNRKISLVDPHVYVGTYQDPLIDEVMVLEALAMGYDVVPENIGAAQASVCWFEETTRAAIMEELALRPTADVEWIWDTRDRKLHIREAPTAPESRSRWYVIKTTDCDYGVTTDEEQRYDFVKVVYKIAGSGTFPRGTVRTLYRPSTPPDAISRCGLLDITEEGPTTVVGAQSAGDQWIAWNSAQAHSGPIGNLGAYLKTIDGIWSPACHARTGDWITPIDAPGRPTLYITGVDVTDPADVILHTGGSEVEDFEPLGLPHPKPKRRKRKRKKKKRKPKRRK